MPSVSIQNIWAVATVNYIRRNNGEDLIFSTTNGGPNNIEVSDLMYSNSYENVSPAKQYKASVPESSGNKNVVLRRPDGGGEVTLPPFVKAVSENQTIAFSVVILAP